MARLLLVVLILLLLLGSDAAKRGRGRARPPTRHSSTNQANVEVSTSTGQSTEVPALVDIAPAGAPVSDSALVGFHMPCCKTLPPFCTASQAIIQDPPPSRCQGSCGCCHERALRPDSPPCSRTCACCRERVSPVRPLACNFATHATHGCSSNTCSRRPPPTLDRRCMKTMLHRPRLRSQPSKRPPPLRLTGKKSSATRRPQQQTGLRHVKYSAKRTQILRKGRRRNSARPPPRLTAWHACLATR